MIAEWVIHTAPIVRKLVSIDQVRRPLLEGAADEAGASSLRHPQLEDDQRDGDRKDPVAEGLEATQWEL